MSTEPGIAQNERRGSGEKKKLDLLLVVPDGHAVSGTEWGRLSWTWSRPAKFWSMKFSAGYGLGEPQEENCWCFRWNVTSTWKWEGFEGWDVEDTRGDDVRPASGSLPSFMGFSVALAAAPSEEGGGGGGVEVKALMSETTQQTPENCVCCSTEQIKILWSDTRYLCIYFLFLLFVWSCIFLHTWYNVW